MFITGWICFFSVCVCAILGSENSNLDISVSIRNVTNEFIVRFKHYYWKHTREAYIQSALNRQNITICTFGHRMDMSLLHPSDFEVVHCALPVDRILISHPAIKAVNIQSVIFRQLNYFSGSNNTINTRQDTSLKSYDRQLLGLFQKHITELLDVPKLWSLGITGKGIKVAVFDTGLPNHHPHFRNVKERTNWTNEKSLDDGVSHGTFVSGVIASSNECLGIAPDVELHIFRVFSNKQVSYTSWFLDAFNYAMFKKINVLNLSIGGPDFMDHPFVDKVSELAANKIITVSAIGNDGPLYGTLNNPGDQSDVVGVGGINSDELVAKFSSRGMTTWELPNGYGRIKPDIVTYGSHVKGSSLNGGCISLSGTSVASPVVAGAVALILSGAPKKLSLINQALVKQILAEGAVKLQHNNIFEQGHGKLNISKSLELLLSYEPKITLSPPYIDYSESYMWPYSSQPLHCVGMPSIVNVTIWNAISVTGRITSKPEWQPNLDKNGDLLLVEILYSQILWPWTGWMAVKISVTNRGCYYEGNAEGSIKLVVYSSTQNNHHRHTVQFPIKVKIAPKPPRHKRILWDQYHNIQYPPGYIPRDSLKIKSDPLDWRGDHIHTNFRDLYHHLRNRGYYIDVLGAPYTCFNASEYGSLLIIDPEEEFFDEEIYKLQKDVFDYGLGVVIFADWYNTTVMKKMQFFDENTREWWIPDTGGANIPALNDLLHGFGISLSDIVADGYIQLGEHSFYYGSGTTLDTFPQDDDTILISALLNDQGAEVIRKKTDFKEAPNTLPIIGLFQMNSRHRIKIDIPEEFPTLNVDVGIELNGTENDIFTYNPAINKRVLLQSTIQRGQQETNSSKDEIIKDYVGVQTLRKEGRVAIMGDSNCIDSINAENACMWLINAFLEYTMNSHTASVFKKYNSVIQQSRIAKIKTHPKRLKTSKLHKYSKVVDVNNKLRKRSLTKCTV